MVKTAESLKFDPGFAPHILAFEGTISYLYTDINRFKNLSQKQMKFKMYYKKMLQLLNNNLGFYIGCLMWAVYLKSQPQAEISGNHCFGKNFTEEDNKADTQFALNFVNLFPRDMKYFAGQDYSFDESVTKILETYEEFSVINKGFVETKYNTDIVLPENLKTENVDKFKKIIENAIQSKDLSRLLNDKDLII